ncbi:Bug family tripartite tricarboxylate transporter substrate binding protein [Variovorax ginsengisoli]|uniref:Tripartite-type tricarboxylate transporter receptor subunit TctC n=1 Tax=Variovorax ginsengisoli TaxID=363844 RepID=A0ABT9S997_9BURK|nr:tripartite tricarboxylate transporter substrate binding protein [Variovorax ginsengisoli]MDP9900929.1 tripartite-type tricarboxylate transporter receptor subunit TctC [Variovorax ginsengisoli]
MHSFSTPRRRVLALAGCTALAGLFAPIAAQTQPLASYPAKPVRLVVGYAAGGATDVIARLIAVKLSEQMGQQFVVDNRAGANSNVGADIVAHSPPDGATLYLFTIANTINATLYDKLNFNAQKDLEPVGLIARVPNILVVNPKLPIRSVAEYLKFAADSPNGITFASSGSGSSIHLSGEMFKMVSKANMLHIPYKGSAPAVTDLLGGQVQSMFDNTPSSLPHVQSGRLRAIAITSARRSPLLPDVPTVAESGYSGFDVQSWFGIAAPTGTPRSIVDRLNTEINKALALPDVKRRLGELAATAEPGTPEQFRTLIVAETKRWHDVVKASGAKAE